MDNKKKNKSQESPGVNNIIFDISNLDILACLIIVWVLFSPTLIRPWLIYDESVIADGTYFPTPSSLGEFFEIIGSFGLGFNISSSNTIYSSNYVTRSCPLAQIFGMLISFFFKKEPLLYHFFNLTLHSINICLVYFILKIFISTIKDLSLIFKRTLLILLTSIWAVHPVIMEPVLLSINCGASFSYMFFFGFLLDFLVNKENNKKSEARKIIIPILFLIPMLMNEYIVTLPLVLFVISFSCTYQQNPLKKALKLSINETKPYLSGLILYTIYFLFLSHYRTSGPITENQFIAGLQRIFWLAPQIFFHLIELVVFPKTLSIDQTLFVKLGKTLFDPYSIFCIIFLLVWLVLPLSLFLIKKKIHNVFLLSWAFFLALLPFLHILMPSYTLACERYLYCPLALLIFGVGKMLAERASTRLAPTFVYTVSAICSVILILCLVRSHYRTLDWKDNYTFINSSYMTSKNNLFKAMRLGMLGKVITVLEPEKEIMSKEYFFKTLDLLQKARAEITELKQKNKPQPLVLKSYGLDYDSLLSKVAFLEASSRYIELKEDYKVGLNLLEPFIKKPERVEPRVLELYIHFLLLDKNYNKAKRLLLRANKLYPQTSFIFSNLIDFYTFYEADTKKAEKYLKAALKAYPYEPLFLLKAINFYYKEKSLPYGALYAYLYGLRTQNKLAYEQALTTYLELEQVKNARRTADKLMKIASGDPQTLYLVSKYYYQVKEYKKAVDLLTNAYSLTLKSRNYDLTFEIGNTLARLYLLLGNQDKALLVTQEIFKIAEDNVDRLTKLAKIYKSLGLNEDFKYCLNKIQSLSKGAKV